MDTTFLFSWVKYKFGIRAAKFIIQVLRGSRVTFIRMFSLSSDTMNLQRFSFTCH